MIVGAALIELHIHGATSLKAKRGVIKSVIARVRNRFNVAMAEVDGQDTWQRVVLGVSACGSDAKRVRQVLDRVIDHIESLHLAEMRTTDIEILNLKHDSPPGLDDGELPWHENDDATGDEE